MPRARTSCYADDVCNDPVTQSVGGRPACRTGRREERPRRVGTLGRSGPERYGELLRAVFAHASPAGAPAWAGRRGDELLDLVTDHLADAYSDIRLLPDIPARLEAIRHRFFADTDTEEIRATARGYEIALRECPAGALSLECRDLCRVARGVLRALTRCPVEQSQWIARGDPRCVFEIITDSLVSGTAGAEALS